MYSTPTARKNRFFRLVGVDFSDRTHFFCDRTQKLTRHIDVESHTSHMPSRKVCGRLACGQKTGPYIHSNACLFASRRIRSFIETPTFSFIPVCVVLGVIELGNQNACLFASRRIRSFIISITVKIAIFSPSSIQIAIQCQPFCQNTKPSAFKLF